MPDTGSPSPEVEDPRVEVTIRRLSRRAVATAALTIAAVTGVSAFGTWRAERALADVERIAAERRVASCEATNEWRKLFRSYLEDRSSFDPSVLTELPGYDGLDPGVRAYGEALVAELGSSADEARAVYEEYVADFPILDCEALEREGPPPRSP